MCSQNNQNSISPQESLNGNYGYYFHESYPINLLNNKKQNEEIQPDGYELMKAKLLLKRIMPSKKKG